MMEALLQRLTVPLLLMVSGRRGFHMSAALAAEPMKKKKRIDPQVELERIRKKTKRIEKEIKRLELLGRYLKPLEEIEGERQFLRTLAEREREAASAPAETELERRSLLMKDWTRYKWRQLDSECQLLARQRQELYRAMEHLKSLDRGLFDLAAQPEDSLASDSLTLAGPMFTPPLAGAVLTAADGDYRDVTPGYRYSFETDKKMSFTKKK